MFSETIIVGKLAFDPTARVTKNGKQMTSMRIPVTTGYGDYKTTQWFHVTTFGKMAENCEKYLRKGDEVLCKGVVQLVEYDAKDGKKASLSLNAESVTFLSKAGQKEGEQQTSPQPTQPNNDDNPFVTNYTDIPF